MVSAFRRAVSWADPARAFHDAARPGTRCARHDMSIPHLRGTGDGSIGGPYVISGGVFAIAWIMPDVAVFGAGRQSGWARSLAGSRHRLSSSRNIRVAADEGRLPLRS
jgi:hypothetical protein